MNSNQLKLFAIITMVIDHIGYALFPEVLLLRIIGRLSLPIFAFLVAEGYHYTRNIKQYMFRIFIFAIISEIPFDLAFHKNMIYMGAQNIFWTILLALFAIYLYDYFKDKNRLIGTVMVVLTCVISFVMKTDYYVFGVLIIFTFNRLRDKSKLNLFLVSILLILLTWVIAMSKNDYSIRGIYQIFSLFSLYLVSFYNGRLGKKLVTMKYAMYIFYPLHLSIIYLYI